MKKLKLLKTCFKVTAPADVNLATGTVTVKAKEVDGKVVLNTKDTSANNNALVAFKPVTVTR